ncbi:MAG: glycosyl hydrolase, partial [Bryobacteraceae bacterium]|nr:glycosyl hydrolase [Bryobacteraceae bacterium]
DDPEAKFRNLAFLSAEFLDAVRFSAEKARELGLRMDLTLGSGWPFGGPQIPVTLAAGRLRWERATVREGSRRVPLPAIGAGEKFLAVFPEGGGLELTDLRDGAVWLPDGEPPKEVWFFISSRTGMMVKRPAVGAEGFVLDHYDRGALDHYLRTVGEPLLNAAGTPYAIFCDSLEVYDSDWTPDFLDEFRRRRGYDLKPRLPALAAEMADTRRLRQDWARTLTELLEERFIGPLNEWARARGTRLRMQGYGIPPAMVSSNALVDLPEGEGAEWKSLSASRWASSAGHIYGRPVISSETWTWLHSPAFRATPLDMKAEADRHFLQGINQLIGHGWPYTAEGVDYPGWRFYAAAVFNDKNPWWIVMPDVALYLQRLSYLLRQGQPVADVALYLPVADAWGDFTLRRVNLIETLQRRMGSSVIRQILEAGYNFDLFDDRALERAARVDKGALVVGENRYHIVVLPAVETMPLATLERLAEFARSGGVLVATRRLPSDAPGLAASSGERDKLRSRVRELFEGGNGPGVLVSRDEELGGVLRARLEPDVSFSPPVPEVGFVHRRTASADIYSLANTGNTPVRLTAAFRSAAPGAELWDPLSGKASPLVVHQGKAQLELAAYGSAVVVFSKELTAAVVVGGASSEREILDLSRAWRVSFGEGRSAVVMDQLQSWTEDEQTRYFSGVATYEKDFELPHGSLAEGRRLKLDFGEGVPLREEPRRYGMRAWLDAPVREAAVVFVNERRAGAVWCPPYLVDITEFLRAGKNTLWILVANLAVNHMAGRALPDYRLLNLRYGVRFEPQDMDKIRPEPAGLVGGVRLVAAENR